MGARDHEQAGTDLVNALVQLSFALQNVLGRIGTEHDLSIIQLRLLGILRDRKPTMAELARFLTLDKSSVTGLVDRAERRDLVQRIADPEDGRSVRVALTPHGRQLTEAVAPDVSRQVGALVEGLNDVERRRLSALAGRVVLQDAAIKGLDLAAGTSKPASD